MKKYIIKMRGGGKQYAMPAVHDTYKSAAQTLLHYLAKAVDDMDDDSTEIPSNYTIEEVNDTDVNERIIDFEKARQALGLEPNISFSVIRNLKNDSAVLHKKIARFVKEINPKHLDSLIALNQLFTIAEAWNKEDGFVFDPSDVEEAMWFPCFEYSKSVKRFVFKNPRYTIAYANAPTFSRLCFRTPMRAEQFGRQFEALFNKVLQLWKNSL